MILIYLGSGIHAGLFMGKYINSEWPEEMSDRMKQDMLLPRRSFMHHTLYWVGLFAGLLSLVLGKVIV